MLFEIYEACSLVVSDHWHSLGMLRDSGSNFLSGSIAPLKNTDLGADTVLSLSSFVRCGSGLPVQNFLAIIGAPVTTGALKDQGKQLSLTLDAGIDAAAS